MSVPGWHNALNATAALIVSVQCGADVTQAAQQLGTFHGALRRFQIKGEREGVTVIDDYAHHPTEVTATLAAAREKYGSRRILAIFQPHTYSRTEALWDDLLTCFGDADQLYVTDIYRARPKEQATVNAQQLAQAIDHDHAIYCGTLPKTLATVSAAQAEGDVVITLGAGDVNWVGEQLLCRQETL